mmetsp:Transcript_18039/g.25691  ORF Transcript_18039/g.25691 Transcript_18039/m.25691 type:complete len:85 (-) Transcript_18039:1602-1856(-)
MNFAQSRGFGKQNISHVVCDSDPRHRKKMPATLNTLIKAVDLWLNEESIEKRKYFFLKVDGRAFQAKLLSLAQRRSKRSSKYWP